MLFARISRLVGTVAGAAWFALAPRLLVAQPPAVATGHRAILLSFDGFSEQRFREYADSASAPHLWSMFRNAVCAETVRPAFPSVTPAGHAAIWTGAYANVNGVSSGANGRLPVTMSTILETTDGYRFAALRAEPIWISAARQGKTVYTHNATQSPQPPLYIPVVRPIPSLDSARVLGIQTMAKPTIASLNIYNELIEPARVITSPSSLSWAFGSEGDSLHAAIVDDSTVRVTVNHVASRSVTVTLAPVDTAPVHARPLARFFSAPLQVDLARDRQTFVYFRLFELSHDGSSLLLFVSEARVMQGNRPDVVASYNAAVQGVPGNGGGRLLEHGDLGPRVPNGGNGLAEWRYLETAELVARQFLRGSAWGEATYHADLTTDYFPYPDEALHTFLGYADRKTPRVTAAARANAKAMLKRAYALVDVYLEHVQAIAAGDAQARLYVTGEHGMRPVWMMFKPNVLLAQQGFLVTDTTGRIVLRRSKAATTDAGWITVNRATRNVGTVPADSVEPILDRIAAALRQVRDSAGTRIVTRVFRAGTIEGDSLGIGGPTGGDLYFDLAPGYEVSPSATGSMIQALDFPKGEHGYPSIDRDMQPALCVYGAGAARRIGAVRSIDIAPSVSAWLGIDPPRDARGNVVVP